MSFLPGLWIQWPNPHWKTMTTVATMLPWTWKSFGFMDVYQLHPTKIWHDGIWQIKFCRQYDAFHVGAQFWTKSIWCLVSAWNLVHNNVYVQCGSDASKLHFNCCPRHWWDHLISAQSASARWPGAQLNGSGGIHPIVCILGWIYKNWALSRSRHYSHTAHQST